MTTADIQHAAAAAAIKALIQAFFDAINAADTTALQSRFSSPRATLTIIRQDPPGLGRAAAAEDEDEDEPKHVTVVMRTTIGDFVRLIDQRPPSRIDIHEAPDLDATEVRVDAAALFATAWSPFRVEFDGRLHHYGAMAFVLVKLELPDGRSRGRWAIEGLTQSYRRAPGWPEPGAGGREAGGMDIF